MSQPVAYWENIGIFGRHRRTCLPAPPSPPSSQVYWVDVDYKLLARAAISARAFFTALLYLEAWCEETNGRLTLQPPQQQRQPSRRSVEGPGAGGSKRWEKEGIEVLMQEVYSQIDEPDGEAMCARADV